MEDVEYARSRPLAATPDGATSGSEPSAALEALRQIDAWRLQIKLCVKQAEPKWLDGISEALERGRWLVNGERRP